MTTPDKEEMPTEDRTAYLDFDDLETILTVAANGQSGRITPHELRTLVAVYRAYDPMITAMEKIEAWAECRSELHGVFKRIAEEAHAALSTLPVNDRHHSGSDNERLQSVADQALSKDSVRAFIRENYASVKGTDRQTSDDVGRLREALSEALPLVEQAEFLESRAFSYGGGGSEPSPSEWGISVGYQQTREAMPHAQFLAEVADFHCENREEDDGDGKFLTVANKIRAALKGVPQPASEAEAQ